MRTTISRAWGELLWVRTKSARSWSLRDAGPWSSFSSMGIARSASVLSRPLMAISFRSSSATFSGRVGCPDCWRISTSRARTSFSQRLCGYVAAELGEELQGLVALALLVLRVGLPVEGAVGPPALGLDHVVEGVDGLVPGAVVEGLRAALVALLLAGLVALLLGLAVFLARLPLLFPFALASTRAPLAEPRLRGPGPRRFGPRPSPRRAERPRDRER